MSSNNDRYDGNSSAEDAALSRLYSETTTETTPPELDARILAEDRSDLRPRFALPTEWLRPLAWTATRTTWTLHCAA